MAGNDSRGVPNILRSWSLRALPGNAHRVLTIVNYEVGHRQADGAAITPAPTGVPLMPDVVH
jgi:hypothetical protein